MTREQLVRNQCQEFLDSIESPAFIVLGWKKNGEEVDIVQCVKNMNAVEYFTGMTWAMYEVSKQMS